jgi:hypothetical protein
MQPEPERRCHVMVGVSLVLLTIGIGYFVIFQTALADFLVIIAGLFVGWLSFFYCLANASFWR